MANDPRRDALIAAARTFQGVPYALPPDGVHTLDCSLFVLRAFEKAGLPFDGSIRTAEQIRQACMPIAWSDVQAGDLLYAERTYDATEAPGPDGKLATHIGVSLGAGSHQMIDANDSRGNVGVTYLSTPYWQEHLFEARRAPQLLTTSPGGPVTVPTMPRGVDVASYQGQPDWAAVAASGIAFAITKVSEDDDYTNPTFASNWRGIKAAGLIRGGYHFARPENTTDAVQEADYFLARIDSVGGLAEGDLLALDLEAGSGDLGQWALDWLHRVESRVGFKPLVYTGAWFSGPHNLAAYPELGTYGLWLAAYQSSMPSAPAPWAFPAIWQYSDKGTVPGIVGNVDLNMFNGDISRLPLYGKPASSAPPPPPPAPSTWRADLDAELERHASEVQRILSGV